MESVQRKILAWMVSLEFRTCFFPCHLIKIIIFFLNSLNPGSLVGKCLSFFFSIFCFLESLLNIFWKA